MGPRLFALISSIGLSGHQRSCCVQYLDRDQHREALIGSHWNFKIEIRGQREEKTCRLS